MLNILRIYLCILYIDFIKVARRLRKFDIPLIYIQSIVMIYYVHALHTKKKIMTSHRQVHQSLVDTLIFDIVLRVCTRSNRKVLYF